MRLIRPIRVCLPDPVLAGEVATPPLGGLTTRDLLRLSRGSANSFIHVIRSEVDTAEGGPDPAAEVDSGRSRLEAMLAAGILRRQEAPAFYIYEIANAGHSAIGVIADVLVDGYRNGRIRRHEHTRRATEDLLVEHLRRIGAHTDPVALTYKADPAIDAAVAEAMRSEPLLDFATGRGRQRVWRVGANDERRLRDLFDEIDVLYITDGHHRCAAAARHAESKSAGGAAAGVEDHYVLAALYPDSELTLLEFNRCVADIGPAVESLVTTLRRALSVEELSRGADPRPRRRGEIGLLAGGRPFRLTVPDEIVPDDVYGALDAVLLQDLVLGPVLGVTDPRTDRRLRYVAGPEVPDPEAHGCDACFLLYPTDLSDVMRIADAGMVMPPKSTWFEPKVWGGLFVRLLD